MKKYQAPSMAAALAAIRQELGPNAVILHSAQVRRGPLKLLGGGASVEVVAVVPPTSPQPPPPPRSPAVAAQPRPFATPRPVRSGERPRPSAPTGDAVHKERALNLVRALADGQGPLEPSALREMQVHVKELRGVITRMMQQAQWPGLTKLAPPLVDLYQRLIDQEVEPSLAQELVTTIDGELSLQAASDRATVLECLSKHLRRLLPTTGPLVPVPGQPTVLFLIGPTGVGKTTTIAKLAATLAMQRHRVALVTCDTYRIAAIPQLKTYADILGVPFEVAYTPDELTSKVLDHVERDFIIVDTPGRSQRNADQLAELRRFVMAVPARQTFLTVAAGSRYLDMLDVVQRFGVIPFDGLLVTKLDETTSFGPLLGLARQTGKPFTYLTNGQNVPHDISVASSTGLTDMLLEACGRGAPERLAPAGLGRLAAVGSSV